MNGMYMNEAKLIEVASHNRIIALFGFKGSVEDWDDRRFGFYFTHLND